VRILEKRLKVFKTSSAARCQTHRCRNRIAYGIGSRGEKHAGNNYFCEQCIEQIGSSMPIELLSNNPEVQKLIVPSKEKDLECENQKLKEEIERLKEEKSLIAENAGQLQQAIESLEEEYRKLANVKEPAKPRTTTGKKTTKSGGKNR